MDYRAIFQKPSRPVCKQRWGYTTLHDTSQGQALDLPPDHWIEEELYSHDAKRKNGRAKAPALSRQIHPIFAREKWPNVNNDRYNALHQSMVLATNLIGLSGPALACFLPRFRQNTKRGPLASVAPDDENESPSPHQQRQWTAAQRIFEERALESVTWWEDPTMLKKQGWWGINMPDNVNPPFSHKDEWKWEEADEITGYPDTRPIRIGIAGEFADAILANPPGTAKHLVATFLAGVVMMHELGHWCVSHATDLGVAGRGEPFFGDNIEMEIGDSWISWLFCCQMHPEPISLARKNKQVKTSDLFDHGLYWFPTYKCGDTKPVYDTQYSIPLSYIEGIMSNDMWEGRDLSSFTTPRRRVFLGPGRVLFREGHVARIATFHNRLHRHCDESGFAKPGHPKHIDWDHAPFRYADLLLCEKKSRPQKDEKNSSDPPLDLKKLFYKLEALREREILDDRRIVRRETDRVNLDEGFDLDELEFPQPVSPMRPGFGARGETPAAFDGAEIARLGHDRGERRPTAGDYEVIDLISGSDSDADEKDDPMALDARPAALEPSPEPNILQRAYNSFFGNRYRAVSSGRVTKKGPQRPRSITVSEPHRARKGRETTSADPVSLGSSSGGGSGQRSPNDTSADQRPPVPSIPRDVEGHHPKFYTRLSPVQRKDPATQGSSRRPVEVSSSRPRKISSDLSSRETIIGQGTSHSPRRFGNKGKLSNVRDGPFSRPANLGKNTSPAAENAKRRLSETTGDAKVRTPQWEEFDLQHVRILYPRTRSQSRGMDERGDLTEAHKRRKSSGGASLSPRTLESSSKRRRESSVVWERNYGKGRRGWMNTPFDAENRRKSLGNAGAGE